MAGFGGQVFPLGTVFFKVLPVAQTGHLGGLKTTMRRKLEGEDNVTPMHNSTIRTRLLFSCSFPFFPCAL